MKIQLKNPLGNIRKFWPLYLMVIPGVVYLLIFRYIPLFGSLIAFKDYSVFKGVIHSPWVGLKHFNTLFHSPIFYRIIVNTLILGVLNIIFLFPLPIVLALMINEVRLKIMKKSIQTVLNIPHFLSWVIIAGITFDLFAAHGVFNVVRGWFGLDAILVMQREQYFRAVYVFTTLWREAGWNTIVYLAAISSMDPQLYESAMVDGASRLRQIISITFPLLIPTAVILLLMQMGSFLQLGFEQVYNLLTPMTYSVGDIIETYVYRTGIQEARYSFATAVGLFQSVIGFILVMICNKISKITTEGGLW